MKLHQIGAQLFTCRDTLKTSSDIAKTFKRLRAVGYRTVQVSGIPSTVEDDEIIRLLEGEGLTCCATHDSGETILKDPQKIVERLQKFGCKITAYPWPAGIDLTSQESIDALISGLDRSGKVFADAGLILTYHNHNVEFRKLGGKAIFEQIYERTQPAHLQAEIDTYWVQHGGGDVVHWCEKLKNRLPIIHLKDYMTNNENQPQLCEIGAGNLDFKRIFAAAEKSGCEWFVVEQDTCPGDPVDSLAQSFRYITENLLG